MMSSVELDTSTKLYLAVKDAVLAAIIDFSDKNPTKFPTDKIVLHTIVTVASLLAQKAEYADLVVSWLATWYYL